MTLLTTARCLAGCGVLAEGGWAATDAIAARHTEKPPKHPTATETRAADLAPGHVQREMETIR